MNNYNEHIEQDKHLNDPSNGEINLAHIVINKKMHFKFFAIVGFANTND